MANFYQANYDGTIGISEEPEGPNNERIKHILDKCLQINNWKVNWISSEDKPLKVDVFNGNTKICIYIYCWRVSNGGRVNRPDEKRIQIQTNVSQEGFDVLNSHTQKSLLLGIYEREGIPIIVAWEIEKNKNHGKSKSCFVNVTAIAKAMRDGFAQYADNNGNIICAFREEFFYFYIMNIKKLHNTFL